MTLSSEQDRYNQAYGEVSERECVCGEWFEPQSKDQNGCCAAHEDAIECVNCESISKDVVDFKGLQFCSPECVSQWWSEIAQRWGEDR